MGTHAPPPISLPGASMDRPLTLMRLGDQDLAAGMRAIAAGTRPTAVVTGIAERPEFLSRVRRVTGDLRVPWFADPLLFKTALPGYRASRYIQDVDYAPGRDADPYTPADFRHPSTLRSVGRSTVGQQFDIGAAGAFTGAFVVEAMSDDWMAVNAELLRIGADARDALGGGSLLASVPVRLKGFESLEAQRLLVRSLLGRRPDGYLLMLDGLHEGSGANRIVAALRLALLLGAASAPVVLGRAGALRQLFWAFGVRGAEFGLGRLLRFYVPDYSSKGGPGAAPARFELPSLVFAQPSDVARRALGQELVPESDCDCPSCQEAAKPRARVDRAAEHDAHVAVGQAADLGGVEPAHRVAQLDRRLAEARYLWEDLRAEGLDLGSPAKIDAWRRAIDIAVESGFLQPSRLAAELRVFD